MKVTFPRNLDINRVFNQSDINLTESSMWQILTDIAKKNAEETIDILENKLSIVCRMTTHTLEVYIKRGLNTIDLIEYPAVVVERHFLQHGNFFMYTDVVAIK